MPNSLPDIVLPAGASRQDKVAALRAHLARITPARPVHVGLPTGSARLDSVTGGWPTHSLSEILGRPGTGRLSLVLPALRIAASQGQHVAIVDPVGWLHPPGLPDLPLDRLMLVRPGGRALWATEQLARCGALPLVLLLDPAPLGRGSRRLQHAAEAGGCALIIIAETTDRQLKPTLRLQAEGHRRFRLVRGGRRPGVVIDA